MFTITMWCWVIYCCFIYFVNHVNAERVSYTGAQVWRSQLTSPQNAEAFLALADQQAISIWNMNSRFVDYLVRPSKRTAVYRVLYKRRLVTSLLIEDVQRTLDAIQQQYTTRNASALRSGFTLDWNSFPRLHAIEEYLKFLSTQFSNLCTLTTIGHSVEKRPIHMLKISNGNSSNKVVIMTAGIHAREWIAITSALYLMDTLAIQFDSLPSYMRSIDWNIIPVLNPDGYEYTHTEDRLWRKNRQTRRPKTANEPPCLGVDLNRNFGHDWYVPGLAKNNCDSFEEYSGPHPFSEPETQAVRDFMQTLKRIPEAFIDIHTYGQLIMYPWGSKPDPPNNSENLNAVATAMSEAIFESTEKSYTAGNAYKTVYPTTGMQADWFLSQGVKYSYVFEMRDSRGTIGVMGRGFLLPPEHIEPTGNDLLAAVMKLAEVLTEKIDLKSILGKNVVEEIVDKIKISKQLPKTSTAKTKEYKDTEVVSVEKSKKGKQRTNTTSILFKEEKPSAKTIVLTSEKDNQHILVSIDTSKEEKQKGSQFNDAIVKIRKITTKAASKTSKEAKQLTELNLETSMIDKLSKINTEKINNETQSNDGSLKQSKKRKQTTKTTNMSKKEKQSVINILHHSKKALESLDTGKETSRIIKQATETNVDLQKEKRHTTRKSSYNNSIYGKYSTKAITDMSNEGKQSTETGAETSKDEKYDIKPTKPTKESSKKYIEASVQSTKTLTDGRQSTKSSDGKSIEGMQSDASSVETSKEKIEHTETSIELSKDAKRSTDINAQTLNNKKQLTEASVQKANKAERTTNKKTEPVIRLGKEDADISFSFNVNIGKVIYLNKA